MTQKRVTKEQVVNSWVGLVVVSIIFIGVFSWWIHWWSWFVWFIPAMCFVGAISTTLTYATQSQVRCPHCGQELRDKARHCPICGVEIVSQCSKCASNVEWGERFCKNCGETLVGQKTPSPAPVPNVVHIEASAPVPAPAPKMTPRFCGLCGEPVNLGAKYCFRCGNQVE